MAHEAQHRADTGRDLVQPGVPLGGRDTGGDGPLLAPEPTSVFAARTDDAGYTDGLRCS